jgi:PIN domain nuclease of toxin-antitoxin system
MTIFVLDSSAVLRFFDKEAGWQRISAILDSYADRTCEVCISAVQWGEIAGRLRKHGGISEQDRVMQKLEALQLRVEPATHTLAVRAAELKIDRNISYADAFALDLAMQSDQHILVTADYDFKKVEDLATIEFLPVK